MRRGHDLVRIRCLRAAHLLERGESETATPEEGWDLSLYILDSCDGDLEAACLAGHDEALAETVVFTPTRTGDVYIVVDGANGEFGRFDLSWASAN